MAAFRQLASDNYYVMLNALPNPFRSFADECEGMRGIEIGGPSRVFCRRMPVYQRAFSIDGVNYSNNTFWEGEINAGHTYSYWKSKLGMQYIDEATALNSVPSESYDFLLSSNCLEHIANPLRALLEWKRVVRTGGRAVVVVPSKVANFDHRRPYTQFDHLLEDLHKDTKEDDLTHLPEILKLHDLSRDPAAGSIERFSQRSLDNLGNRCLHHHVFSPEVLTKAVEHCGFSVSYSVSTRTDHWVFLSVRG